MDTLLELATSKSKLPSSLKSVTATEVGLLPAAKLVALLNSPLPFSKRMDTLLELPLTTTKSERPSLLKSAGATARDKLPVKTLAALLKLPSPLPNNTDTLPEEKPSLATARSKMSSLLKSATATDLGLSNTLD